MKNKMVDDDGLVTRGMFREELAQFEARLDAKFEAKLEAKFDEKLKGYPTRSEMFSRFDQIMRVLEQIREDILFHTHDIRCLQKTDTDHEKRIQKLEEQVN